MDILSTDLPTKLIPRSRALEKLLVAQEVSKFLAFYENRNVHFRVWKSPPAVHVLTHYISKVHFNIILSSTPKSSKLSLRFRFSASILCPFLIPSMLAACPAIVIPIYLITLIMMCEDDKLCPVMTQFSPTSFYFLQFRPNILSILLSDVLNLRSSLRGESRSFTRIQNSGKNYFI